jgi:hypothetical protein
MLVTTCSCSTACSPTGVGTGTGTGTGTLLVTYSKAQICVERNQMSVLDTGKRDQP